MTPKQFVLKKYPEASCRKLTPDRWYVLRGKPVPGFDHLMYDTDQLALSLAPTPRKAWANGAKIIKRYS